MKQSPSWFDVNFVNVKSSGRLFENFLAYILRQNLFKSLSFIVSKDDRDVSDLLDMPPEILDKIFSYISRLDLKSLLTIDDNHYLQTVTKAVIDRGEYFNYCRI